ncbi:MAG: CPBP family intramembrane glutamic endopeptidase [Chlamydiales bacterium]
MNGIAQIGPSSQPPVIQGQSPAAAPARAGASPDVPRSPGGTLKELITVTTWIAAAILYSPLFAFGATIGAVEFMCILPIGALVIWIEGLPADRGRTEEPAILELSLLLPIGEELIFRGLLQPFLESQLAAYLPAMEYTFLGAQITLVTITAIAITALVFGLFHLTNEGEVARINAIFATVGGLSMGYVRSRYGLLASIAQHITFNHLVSCLRFIEFWSRRNVTVAP